MPVISDRPQAKPFLKWAGGKRQLLAQIEKRLPLELLQGEITRYVEPFVGSGALFFKVIQSFPIQECLLADINPELVLVYSTIQQDVKQLISILGGIQEEYWKLNTVERKKYYYRVRDEYNSQRGIINFREFDDTWVMRSAQMIFMNKTGYNGLFRLNSKGEFNVPFGRYKKPRILDAKNLNLVSKLLQGVTIRYGDFEETAGFIGEDTLVYFDPPYRPLSSTAHFTSYSKDRFDDTQQLRLAGFYRILDTKGARLMLSNSDPHNVNQEDDFFEDAYRGFRIERLRARRNINRVGGQRGKISELLILNYNPINIPE